MAFGILGGLATIAVSEVVLRFWGTSSLESVWKALITGMVVRAAWILGLLATVAATGVWSPKPFVISLLAGYLVAQVLEGVRYQRQVRTR
jgi:hypothetical protein